MGRVVNKKRGLPSLFYQTLFPFSDFFHISKTHFKNYYLAEMPTPAILVVRIQILDPAFDTSKGWAKWTKLHFDDLLSLGPASINSTTQFQNLKAATGKDEEEGDKKVVESRFPYFNIIELGNLDVLTSKPYLALSRAKDLAAERKEGEAMIWDVADARFAAYELVEHRKAGGEVAGDAVAGAEVESTSRLVAAEIFSSLALEGAEESFDACAKALRELGTETRVMLRVGRLYKLRNETLNPVPVLESAPWLGLWVVEGGEGLKEVVGKMPTIRLGEEVVEVRWGVYGVGHKAGEGAFV
ncbi:hypothetical protein BU16DRAFT_558816 [Lophium mytilinum]|uniref:Uncharacterized protein n=1 Tax=Lophium mytilinum TaxID=390894 RepID=A0A6A6R2Q7_9PEZI|nr:hypothetical protein BU16DRAFT_558816 [Lophium mytilinum]